MGESSISAAMCKVCGYRHRQGDPHNWGTESKSDRKSIIETLKEDVSRVHDANECTQNIDECVHDIREVNIRKLRANLALELLSLPFVITKGGVPIADVNPPDPEKTYFRKLAGGVKNYKDELKKECSICGYNKCKASLDFHHIENKGANISQITSVAGIKEEIDKNPVVILCSNCHRELHWGAGS